MLLRKFSIKRSKPKVLRIYAYVYAIDLEECFPLVIWIIFFIHNFSGLSNLQLSNMHTDTKIMEKDTNLFKLVPFDNFFCFIRIINHQRCPEAIFVNVPVPANTKDCMDGFFVQFGVYFWLRNFGLEIGFSRII